MIQQQIEELLKARGITKTEFADKMGIKKQNVNLLLQTNDLRKLQKIADILDVELSALINQQPSEYINGFVEVNGTVYKVRSREDIEDLLKEI